MTTYTDNSTSTAYSVAPHGATGAKGDTGSTGNGVKSTTTTYQLSSSGTDVPTGTWSNSPLAPTTTQYLWTKTVTTYTNGSTSTAYSVGGKVGATGAKGDPGAKGADAITMAITTDNGTVFKNNNGSTTLTAHVYRAGAELSSQQIAQLGTIKWYKDGGTTSVGSGATLSVSASSVTLAWSAGIVATTRYYQLAAPTAATPTVPTSSSSLGSWSETEPTADVTKVLWTCERTVYADGTESWSKASKSTSYEAAKDAKSTATDAQTKAQDAQEQVEIVAANLSTTSDSILATIDSKVSTVQQGVDSNDAGLTDLNDRLTSEIKARRSFMRFSEESSDPTLTLGQTDSPAQVKLTNKQLQFLYLNTVVAYMSGDALLINNAKILQQLQLGGFAFVPRDNGNLAFKWVGGDS